MPSVKNKIEIKGYLLQLFLFTLVLMDLHGISSRSTYKGFSRFFKDLPPLLGSFQNIEIKAATKTPKDRCIGKLTLSVYLAFSQHSSSFSSVKKLKKTHPKLRTPAM